MQTPALIVCILSVWMVARYSSASEFLLREEKISPPETGEIIKCTLVCGEDTFAFVPPRDWRVSVQPDQQRIIFRNPDLTSTIALVIISSGESSGQKLDEEALREQLRNRYPKAQIIDEFPCYTAGLTGRGFDIKWTAGNDVPTESRVACFVAGTHYLEFTVAAPLARFRALCSSLGQLLTSFQQKDHSPDANSSPTH